MQAETASARVEQAFRPALTRSIEKCGLQPLRCLTVCPQRLKPNPVDAAIYAGLKACSTLANHRPKLDADLYLPGLLEGFLGSKQWMASRLGQMGGKSRSAAKKAASRANGRLGGRPKKAARR